MINLFFVCKVRGIYKQGQYLKEMKKNGRLIIYRYWMAGHKSLSLQFYIN
jgi:hypothetical protein